MQSKKTGIEPFGICMENNVNELLINNALIHDTKISETTSWLLTPPPSLIKPYQIS